MSASDVVARTLEGELTLGVWGCGYIGASALYYFAGAGINCRATDPSARAIELVTSGYFQGTTTSRDIRSSPSPEAVERLSKIQVSCDPSLLFDQQVQLHLICVPTEHNGVPTADAVVKVLSTLLSGAKTTPYLLLVFESTLSPTWFNQIILPMLHAHGRTLGVDVAFAAAPRRDRFWDESIGFRTIRRVVGGSDADVGAACIRLYSQICDSVVSARDARHAALAKLVENVFRYVDLTLANELAACFPGYDLTHALALAGSKWDMNTYHPSLGIGGYCIPLAPRYLQIEGARLPKTLEQACAVNTTHLDNQFAGPLARLARCRTIAILGLSYAPNCGIANGSLTPSYTERLKSCGCDVWVHDPYFAPKDIERHTGVGALEDPRCLADVEGIIIMTDHRAYRECALDWVSYLRRGTVVVDNFGTWRAVAAERELDYYELGRPRA